MDPKQAVHTSAWCHPVQSGTALLGIRTQPCTAVEQGSEPFKQEQELMSLTQGTSLMETGRKKTKTSHKEEVEMTKPN